MLSAANAAVARIALSSLLVARTFNFARASITVNDALGGCNVDPLIGSDGRGVVIAEGPQPFVIQQLACLCHSTENEPAVLESIKASIIVQGGRNARHTPPVGPGDNTATRKTRSKHRPALHPW